MHETTLKQYKDVRRLYQFHQKRRRYEFISQFMLPRFLYRLFFNYYKLHNAKKIDFVLNIFKFLMVGTLFYFIFSFITLDSWLSVIYAHGFFMFFFISITAHQISFYLEKHKNDFLMNLLNQHKQKMILDEINEHLHHGYVTFLIPLTFFTMLKFAIDSYNPMIILGYVMFVCFVFVIAKFLIIKLYHLKFIIHRHSYFKDLLIGFIFFIVSILVYAIFLSPVNLIEEDQLGTLTFVFGLIYAFSVISIGTYVFNRWLKRFINKHFIQMIYPRAFSLSNHKPIKYLSMDSVWLKGLCEIEKAILIKDQKTLKRKDRKTYYSILFFGLVALITSIQYISMVLEDVEIFSVFTLSMIFSGIIFTYHMITTSMAKPFLSYSAEGSLTRTYQRLGVSKKNIYKAKLRGFSLVTLSILIIHVITQLTTIWIFSVDYIGIILFSMLYVIGLSYFKLKLFMITDVFEEKAYLYDHFGYNGNISFSLFFGFCFVFLIPLGIALFTQVLVDAFGMFMIYGVMSVILLILGIAHVYLHLFIKKKLTKSEVLFND